MKNMKKLSEVCKEVGVTRRTLQGYDDIGLLHPTEKTPSGGYWLYDDAAIDKLKSIQVFVMCGFQRREIKEIFSDKGIQNFNELFDGMLATLEDKRKQIDGMIALLKSYTFIAQLPASTVKTLARIGYNNMPETGNFSENMQQMISDLLEMGEEKIKSIFEYSSALITIGRHKDDSCDSPVVIECFDKLVDSMLQMLPYDEDIPNPEEIQREDFVDVLYEYLNEVLSDDEMKNMLESQCGEGATEYILEAAKVYEQKFKKNQKEEG